MLVHIVIGLLVVALILYRQMRPIAVGGSPKAAIILTVIGAVSAVNTLQTHRFTVADLAILAASTIVGLAIAVMRAYTVQIYRDPVSGTTMGRGTAVTAGLWLVGIATHVGIEAFATAGLGGSTLLFYLGSVLLVQNLVVTARAQLAPSQLRAREA